MKCPLLKGPVVHFREGKGERKRKRFEKKKMIRKEAELIDVIVGQTIRGAVDAKGEKTFPCSFGHPTEWEKRTKGYRKSEEIISGGAGRGKGIKRSIKTCGTRISRK